MTRTLRITSSITTLALAGSIALSPLAALAEDSVNADASVKAGGERSSLFARFGFGGDRDSMKAEGEAGMHGRKGGEGRDGMKKDGEKHGGQDRIEKATVRADASVDTRIEFLEKLQDRIQNLKHITDEQKTSLNASLDTQIASLVALKAKIGSDTSSSTLKADIKSIRPEFRIFAVVAPQAAITAASDRIIAIVGQMDTVSAKIDARIEAAKTEGQDTAAMEAAYADYKSKIADAKVQAEAAADLVVDLKADAGDAAVQASNATALKNARAKIKLATDDLKAARADLATIIGKVKGVGVRAEGSAKVEKK